MEWSGVELWSGVMRIQFTAELMQVFAKLCVMQI